MSPEPLATHSKARTRSPDGGGGGSERKRRRKVLSCYDCRRRKLQCDRALPACSRCTKAGQAANCLYIDDASDIPSRDVESSPVANAVSVKALRDESVNRVSYASGQPGDVLSRLEYQDTRIKQLEEALALAHQKQGAAQKLRASQFPPTPESIIGVVDYKTAAHDKDTALLRGKSFKTQFSGNTNPIALVAHINELHAFMKDTFEQFPALSRIREDMHRLEHKTDCAGEKHDITTDNDLKAFLSPKEETDQLVRTYLDNYGSMFHVFHMPTFWKEYNAIWTDITAAKAHSVAIVLLMTASAQCLNVSQAWMYTANSSVAREKAVAIVQAIEDWLSSQSQKKVTAADFQIRFLVLFAKQVVARKLKRTWTECGTDLRFCMAAGLHRNPDMIRKPTSLLDKELRRRIWAAITELELQAAFDRGMIAMPWALQSDCPPPSNMEDEDMDKSTEQEPSPRQPTEFTNTSYLSIASQSIILRTTINTHLNNIRPSTSFEEMKRLTEEIEAHVQAIPEWMGSRSDLPRALLRLNLWQYTLALHDRHIRLAENKFERDFCRMVLLETASRIIDTHESFTSKGCYALEILRCDQLRAALSVCQVAVTMDPHADDALSKVFFQTADRIISNAIEMITDKTLRFGREQRQLWILLATNSFMHMRRDPSNKLVYMQEAVDKITRPYYKIMACQDDAPTQVSTTASVANDMPNGILEYYSNNLPQHKALDGSGLTTDPGFLDMDDIAAWTFEDFSLNPADLSQTMGAPSNYW